MNDRAAKKECGGDDADDIFERRRKSDSSARRGGTQEVRQHLEDLGFVPGTEVTGVSAAGNGNVIVAVKSTRLAISAKMAEKIFVAEGGSRR